MTLRSAREWVAASAALGFGLLLAFWVARVYFLLPAGQCHDNHESWSYVARLLEFRDCLAAGYLFPQWCTHFRGALGSPYFSYYQPGLFYVASLLPAWIPPVRALGLTVLAFAILGYAGMYLLVRQRFGGTSGVLAASSLVLSVYARTEIYIRGDLSEFAAMMTLPSALYLLWKWLHTGSRWSAVASAICCAALVLLHPAVALMGYGAMAVALLIYALDTRRVGVLLSGGAILAIGTGLAAFYWLPVALEWQYESAENAYRGDDHYARHFVEPAALFTSIDRGDAVPFTLGPVLPAVVFCNALLLLIRWNDTTRGERRYFAAVLVTFTVAIWLISPYSAAVWPHLPLLEKLKFPWRFLALATVAGAAAAGAMLPWRMERRRRLLIGFVLAVMFAHSSHATSIRPAPARPAPQEAADLARVFFAPDWQDEWLPRGADADAGQNPPHHVIEGPGCQVNRFSLSQGTLRCHVQSPRASFVELPHYYFPVGWQATFAGRPVPLGMSVGGRMRVELHAQSAGWLEVRFTSTPMRRWGLLISAASLLCGLPLVALWAPHGRVKRAAPSPLPQPLRPAVV